MRFSEHFRLGLSQPELDFVDVELNRDTPLFVDPYSIGARPDHWSRECSAKLTLYFDALLHAVRHDDDDTAGGLLASLHEPNETRLGLSSGRPQGNAIGDKLARDMLRSLKASAAVRTGLLRDLADGELFVDGIGHDRISDLSTNVLRSELIGYTQEQCKLHGIRLAGTVASGPMWNSDTREWEAEHVELPVVDGRKVLLIPKAMVRWTPLLTPSDYYNNFVLNFLVAQEMETGRHGLVRRLRKGGRRVYKRDVKELYPFSKDLLRTFSEQYPQVLERYKLIKKDSGINPEDLFEGAFDERLFARTLIEELRAIPPGNDAATRYHRLMVGILEFIFYPQLLFPEKENEIDEGRKRIDIVYTNGASHGLFARFSATTRLESNRIIVECKNYSSDPANPEVDQITGRFAHNRGWLGLLVFRTADDIDTLVARCRDTARAGRGYVIPLADEDIVEMLDAISNGRRQDIDGLLDQRFRELTR